MAWIDVRSYTLLELPAADRGSPLRLALVEARLSAHAHSRRGIKETCVRVDMADLRYEQTTTV